MKKLLLVLLLFLPWPSFAANAFKHAADLGDNGGSTSSLTTAYSVDAASNLLVVVFLGDVVGGADDCSAPTYNSVTMTAGPKNALGTLRIMYYYYLLAPATGSHNVVLSCSTSHYIIAVAADYSGVNQTGQPDNSGTSVSSGASSTTFNATLTTVADNSWMIVGNECYNSGGPPEAAAGSTLRISSVAIGTPAIFDSGDITPAASHAIPTNCSMNSGFYIADTAVSFAPDTGGGGGSTHPNLTTLGAGE